MFLIMVLFIDPSFLLLTQWKKFSSLLWSQTSNCFSLVVECHLIVLRCFHKPTTSLFVSLLVFQQLRSILLCKDAFQADLWYKLGFSSPPLCPNNLASILSFRRHCDVALFTHHLALARSCSSPCLSIYPECCVISSRPSSHQALPLFST